MKHLGYQKDRSNFKTMLVAFFMLAIISALLILSFKQVESVFALANNHTAVKAGNGEELWNAESSSFNYNVLLDLKEKLFGNDNPVDYIKSMKDEQTQANVVPATAINERLGNTEEGMVVNLGGREWTVASLTLADIDDKKDNVVLTLYATNYFERGIEFHKYIPDSQVRKGYNAYSSSNVRNILLTNTAYSLFNNPSEGSFASQFLVQPKNIKYQRTQTGLGRQRYYKNMPNEALDAFTDGWYSGIYYQPDDVFEGIRYDAWGEDYIWLPSCTEATDIGIAHGEGNNSIWKLTKKQRAYPAYNSFTDAWLRSGFFESYDRAFAVDGSGSDGVSMLTEDYALRPAIHLNLTAAGDSTIAKGINFDENSDFEYIYKDSNNVRQSYVANGYEHNSNDKEIATSNGVARYVLGNIKLNTNLNTLINNLKNDTNYIKVYDNNKNIIFDGSNSTSEISESVGNKVIGTGWYIELYNIFDEKAAAETVYLSVLGDLNGDGRISASDVMYLREIASNKALYDSLDTEVKLACMILNKGLVTSVDSEILLNIMAYNLSIDIFY